MKSPILFASPNNMISSPIQPQKIINKKTKEKEDNKLPVPTLQNELFQILNFAWPVTLATMARVAMYSIDTAFLGHLGTAELAGSAMASLCANFVSTFLYAPAYGLNSLCSQAIGAGNSKLAGIWFQLSIGISSIMLLPSFLILFNVRPIISPFEHDENVLHFASVFGRYATCFLVPTFIYMAIRQYFQALQIVHPATIVSIISVGINVLLNQILIHGLHIHIQSINLNINWNGFGFIGSPLATTFSLTFQLLLFCSYAILYKQYPIKAGAWDGWTIKAFQWKRVLNFFKVIGPMMIGDATENWSYQVVVLFCSKLPDDNVASNTVIFNIWGLLWSVYWGIGLATIVRVGKNIGNGDINGTKLVIKIALILSLIINGIISIICYFLRKSIAQIFTSDPDVILILDHSIPILSLLFFFGGIGWVASSAMEGMARNIERSLIYSVTAWLMYVPSSIYLGVYSKWHNKSKWSAICLIWYSALLVEIIRCILIWIVLLRTNWTKQVRLAKKRSEALKEDKNENNKTSPKTRKLIQNDGLNDFDNDNTAMSLHQVPKDNTIIKHSQTTDDYLCLN